MPTFDWLLGFVLLTGRCFSLLRPVWPSLQSSSPPRLLRGPGYRRRRPCTYLRHVNRRQDFVQKLRTKFAVPPTVRARFRRIVGSSDRKRAFARNQLRRGVVHLRVCGPFALAGRHSFSTLRSLRAAAIFSQRFSSVRQRLHFALQPICHRQIEWAMLS